jgi:hypothetical protein
MEVTALPAIMRVLNVLLILCPFLAAYIAGQDNRFYDGLTDSYSPPAGRIYEIWGWLSSAILISITLLEAKKRKYDLTSMLQNIFPYLTAQILICAICSMAFVAYDWNIFKLASVEFMSGRNPYTIPRGFPWPPVITYVYAGWHMVAEWLLSLSDPRRIRPGTDWLLVFFFIRVYQGMAIWALGMLTRRYAMRLGFHSMEAQILSLLLVFCSFPVWIAFKLDQPVHLVAATILAAVLLSERHQALAGVVAGIGAVLKLYPIMLLWPWLLERKWIPIATFIILVFALFFADYFGGRIGLWREWLSYEWNDPQTREGFLAFRAQGVPGVIRNIVIFSGGTDQTRIVLQWIVKIGLIGWLIQRFWQRRRLGGDRLGDLSDALVFPLLMHSDMWEHAYVFAIPVWLYWLMLRLKQGKSITVSMVIWALMFGLPRISMFPLSYHRLAALLWGMILSQPSKKVVPPSQPLESLPSSYKPEFYK